MQDYRRLDVWVRAHRLALGVYAVTANFPAAERFGLSQQVRRASVSVASNIVEGASRSTKKDFARFLDIARGSLGEVEYQLLLAGDLGYLEEQIPMSLMEDVAAVGGMLTNLVRSVRGQTVPTRD